MTDNLRAAVARLRDECRRRQEHYGIDAVDTFDVGCSLVLDEKSRIYGEHAESLTALLAQHPPETAPTPPVPIPRWKCRTCGCLWRDNLDGMVSLFDAKQKSCAICEIGSTDSKTCDIDWVSMVPAPASRGDASRAGEGETGILTPKTCRMCSNKAIGEYCSEACYEEARREYETDPKY